jgi:hypothetical protein
MFKICKFIKQIDFNFYKRCDCSNLCKVQQTMYDHEDKYLYPKNYDELLKILNKENKK